MFAGTVAQGVISALDRGAGHIAIWALECLWVDSGYLREGQATSSSADCSTAKVRLKNARDWEDKWRRLFKFLESPAFAFSVLDEAARRETAILLVVRMDDLLIAQLICEPEACFCATPLACEHGVVAESAISINCCEFNVRTDLPISFELRLESVDVATIFDERTQLS